MYGSVQPGVAIPDGVVLKVVRNGNPTSVASQIELLPQETTLEPTLQGVEQKASAFNYKIQQSRIIAVNVFDHESIYFRDIPKVTQLDDEKVLRFANGLSSSDLSRSGWCPGTVSYPVYIRVGDLKAGEHQLKIAIPVGDPADSSISYWCISGVLVGDVN